jgi:D-alanine-D-alanine ligase
MDKAVAKKLLAAAGIAVAPAVVVRAQRWAADQNGVVDEVRALGPAGVREARPAGGSSIGITRSATWRTCRGGRGRAALRPEGARRGGPSSGREIECGILEDADGRPQASVPAEVRVTAGYEFYDFEAKYLDAAEPDIPADLPADVAARCRSSRGGRTRRWTARGLARVDFFVGPDGELTVNEVNTMPGFTPTSMFPRMWAASGSTTRSWSTGWCRRRCGGGPGLR